MKAVLEQRNCVNNIDDWEEIMNNNIFNTSRVYKKLQMCDQKVELRSLMYGNTVRPRACFIIWLTCHGRLSTKDMLYKFGLIDNKGCCFCPKEEFVDHLFFKCPHTRNIWKEVLDWIQVQENPKAWIHEIEWLIQQVNEKSARAAMLKMAITETVYEI